MLNEDITKKESILLFKNNSDCNIVLRIEGKDYYNLAVPARGENFIIVNKGSYTLTSNVCDMKYFSQKDIKRSIFVTINNPGQPETQQISDAKISPEKPLKKKEKQKNNRRYEKAISSCRDLNSPYQL